MKQALIAVVLVGVAAVLAHMHVVSQTYHPVTRVASPDGLVFTVVQNPTTERRTCGAANDRFLLPIKSQCSECKVVLARCERELEPFEVEIFEGKAAGQHQVLSPGMRMTIDGPQHLARTGCEALAAQLLRNGYRRSRCLPPTVGQNADPAVAKLPAG